MYERFRTFYRIRVYNNYVRLYEPDENYVTVNLLTNKKDVNIWPHDTSEWKN